MKCIYCQGKTRVYDTRPHQDTTKRQRRCTACKRTFTTTEALLNAPHPQAEDLLKLIKTANLHIVHLQTVIKRIERFF